MVFLTSIVWMFPQRFRDFHFYSKLLSKSKQENGLVKFLIKWGQLMRSRFILLNQDLIWALGFNSNLRPFFKSFYNTNTCCFDISDEKREIYSLEGTSKDWISSLVKFWTKAKKYWTFHFHPCPELEVN